MQVFLLTNYTNLLLSLAPLLIPFWLPFVFQQSGSLATYAAAVLELVVVPTSILTAASVYQALLQSRKIILLRLLRSSLSLAIEFVFTLLMQGAFLAMPFGLLSLALWLGHLVPDVYVGAIIAIGLGLSAPALLFFCVPVFLQEKLISIENLKRSLSLSRIHLRQILLLAPILVLPALIEIPIVFRLISSPLGVAVVILLAGVVTAAIAMLATAYYCYFYGKRDHA